MDIMQNAVAKERLLRDAEIKKARARGRLNAFEDSIAALATMLTTAQSAFNAARIDLDSVQGDTGSVVTDGFGPYSIVDTLLRQERFAGKSAAVDFIKANPTCTEEEAEETWAVAAKLATGRDTLMVPVHRYSVLYQENLFAAGYTTEASYETQRAWIIATPKETIMGA